MYVYNIYILPKGYKIINFQYFWASICAQTISKDIPTNVIMFYMKCLKLQGIIQYCYSKLYYETLELVTSVQWEIVSIKFMGPSTGKNCSLSISSLSESYTNTPHHGQTGYWRSAPGRLWSQRSPGQQGHPRGM